MYRKGNSIAPTGQGQFKNRSVYRAVAPTGHHMKKRYNQEKDAWMNDAARLNSSTPQLLNPNGHHMKNRYNQEKGCMD